MTHRRFVKPILVVASLVAVATAAFLSRASWLPFLRQGGSGDAAGAHADSAPQATKIIVSDQAQKNLGVTAKSVKADTFWRKLSVPGAVVDRPGQSDRGIVAPATGVVSAIHHVPGDTVRVGDTLFTLKLLSESLHLTQTDFFKTAQDVKLAQAQRKRLAAASGSVPEARLIETESQIKRLEVAAKAYRQDLLNRGLTPEAIDGVAEGTFVSEITVLAPEPARSHRPLITAPDPKATPSSMTSPPAYELQELRVELGQQVQAGQTLCLLANHQRLSVEGRAFRDELPLLERSFREGWPVEVDFQENALSGWGEVNQTLSIRHIANSIDPVNRTFAFQLPLENESRAVSRDGATQLLWRFRPGQKVRLGVRVEKLENVFVVPTDAVVRDGVDAFVFTQNVNTFERKPVRLLLLERERAVLANDGSLTPGSFVAQRAAAQLNRMVKAGGSGGVPKGYHIHADGSLHKNEDEGK